MFGEKKAFPQPVALAGDVFHCGDDLVEGAGGMSLRNYFAGQALIGLASRVNGVNAARRAEVAELAYSFADALLDRGAGRHP